MNTGRVKNRRRLAAEPWRRIYGTEKWKRTRANARRRAGGRCERCGREAKTLDVHHRIPLKDGGAPYDPDNLEVLCRPCHRELDNAPGSVFRSRAPHLAPVGISLPEFSKVRESSGESAYTPENARNWVGPDGRVWSHDWSRDWDGGKAPPEGVAIRFSRVW